MTDDQIMTRIRKLLALANDAGATENEAMVAASKAQALLAEHNLTLSDVVTDTSKPEIVVVAVETNGQPWRRPLANAVAQLYFCSYYFTRDGYTDKTQHSFVGKIHNVEVARLMFEYLHTTVDRLAREGARGLHKKEQSPYRVTFRSAAVRRLCARIRDRIDEAKCGKMKDVTGTKNLPALLSLYERAQVENKEFLERDPTTAKMKTRPTRLVMLHAKGSRDGDRAGETIGLDPQVGADEKKKRITAR